MTSPTTFAPCHPPCTCCTQRWFLMGCIPPWATLTRCTTLSKLYSSCAPCTSAAVSWRLGTARPNVQHGAGAPHGHFSPVRRSTRVFCAHGRLSAREELQDISRTPETQPIPRLLRIPPPLIPVTTTERNKITRLEPYWYVEVLFGPAYQELSIEISTYQ